MRARQQKQGCEKCDHLFVRLEDWTGGRACDFECQAGPIGFPVVLRLLNLKHVDRVKANLTAIDDRDVELALAVCAASNLSRGLRAKVSAGGDFNLSIGAGFTFEQELYGKALTRFEVRRISEGDDFDLEANGLFEFVIGFARDHVGLGKFRIHFPAVRGRLEASQLSGQAFFLEIRDEFCGFQFEVLGLGVQREVLTTLDGRDGGVSGFAENTPFAI